MKAANSTRRSRLGRLPAAVLLVVGLSTGPVLAQDGLDAEAEKILKSMSSFLGSLNAFRVNADIDQDLVTLEGQKLKISSSATGLLQRPDKLHINRSGVLGHIDLNFDGAHLTLYGKDLNTYGQIELEGTVDDAIREFEYVTGVSLPGADLLLSDPYEILSRGIKKGSYLGTTYIDGIECDYLAFREDRVDWQIWVRKGDAPLPMQYVITSKWQTAAPEFAIRFRDWDVSPAISDADFSFSPPADARKLETLEVDDMGELVLPEENK